MTTSRIRLHRGWGGAILFVRNKMREKHHFTASVIYLDVALADNASNVCNVRPIV